MGLLRNPDARHIDFEAFQGIIPENPKVLPSDIDMVFERKGYFLVAEWKRGNEPVSLGQKFMLQALARNTNFCVLMVRGHTDDGVHIEKFWRVVDGACKPMGTTVDEFRNFVRRWYWWADGKD